MVKLKIVTAQLFPSATPRFDRIDVMKSEDPGQVRFQDGCYSIAELLEKYRPLLKLLAARQLDEVLGARLSASDIVQQTQLEAFRDHGLFRGNSEPQFVAWLKTILRHNVSQATHTHIVAKKRSVKRERSLAQHESNRQCEDVVAKQGTASARIIQGESAVMLARAMEKLTQEQFDAVRLRYLEGCSLASICDRMGRSESAVAGLLKRGLRGLRGILCNEMDA